MLNKQLLQEAKQAQLHMVFVIGLGLGIGVIAILQASFLSQIINAVFLQGQVLGYLWKPLIGLLTVMILRAVFVYLSEITAHRLAAMVKKSLREKLWNHLVYLGPSYVHGERTGELVNLLTEGIEALEAYFSRYLPQLALAVLVPFAVLAWVISIDVTSGLILLCTAPLVPLFMWLIGKWAQVTAQRQWSALSRMSAHFFDVLQGLVTLKIFGRSRAQIETIRLISEDFRGTTLHVLRVAFLSALVLELLTTLSTAIIAVTVGLRLLYFRIPFEEAFFLLLLAPEFYLPLRLLGSHFHAGLAGASAAERIFKVLAEPLPVEPAAGEATVALEQGINITFEQVYYAYEGGRTALQGASFKLKAGERIALVGASGAGKSTVARLLLRFIRPTAGQVTINDIPLAQLSEQEWLRMVTYIPQQPYLFFGTVAENISMGCTKATPSEIIAAAELAGAHGFIEQMPCGYDTVLGDGGRQLSGGQGQLIAIARVFLKNAPFVIMDEPTTGLDPENEHVVIEAVTRLAQDRTTLVITHRLKTVVLADRIIVMDRGRVAEEGEHAELLKRRGAYYRLITAARGRS